MGTWRLARVRSGCGRIRPSPSTSTPTSSPSTGWTLSEGRTLAEDFAWADTVVGCDTMAMVVALAAGRRVVSAIPAGGRPLSLPFAEIERLFAP